MNAVALLPRDRERIISCLNPWQKPGTAGERDAAAAALNRLLEARNLSWEQIIREPKTERAHEPPEPPVYGWRADLATCQRATHRLTPWEANFVSSVAMQRGISAKQAAVLNRIAAKVRVG